MLALYLEWLAVWWWVIFAVAIAIDAITLLGLWLISRRL